MLYQNLTEGLFNKKVEKPSNFDESDIKMYKKQLDYAKGVKDGSIKDIVPRRLTIEGMILADFTTADVKKLYNVVKGKSDIKSIVSHMTEPTDKEDVKKINELNMEVLIDTSSGDYYLIDPQGKLYYLGHEMTPMLQKAETIESLTTKYINKYKEVAYINKNRDLLK